MQLTAQDELNVASGTVAPIFALAKGASTKRAAPNNLKVQLPSSMIADVCMSASKRMRSEEPSPPNATLQAIMDELQAAKQHRESIKISLLATGTAATEAMAKADTANEKVDKVQGAMELLDDKMERRERRSDIVFRGIPLDGKEPAHELVSLARTIMSAVGITAGEADIEYAMVLRGSSILLVRFATVALRNMFFRKYIALRNGLWASHLGYSEEDEERVYAMDNLTPTNAAIRRRAQELKKEGAISNFRVRDGLVYVTTNTDHHKQFPVIRMTELNNLDQLGSPANQSTSRGESVRQGGIWRGRHSPNRNSNNRTTQRLQNDKPSTHPNGQQPNKNSGRGRGHGGHATGNRGGNNNTNTKRNQNIH